MPTVPTTTERSVTAHSLWGLTHGSEAAGRKER
jgi:hypothetical protein